MLRRQHHIGNAERGIRPGGEDGEGIPRFGLELDLHAFAAANPVLLHGFDLFRPTGQLRQIIQQALGIVGDLKEPLFQVLLFHQAFAAFAMPLDNLLVCQNGGAGRAPVHRRLLFIGQAVFEQLNEYPLGPFIVLRGAGGNFPVPVIADAQGF